MYGLLRITGINHDEVPSIRSPECLASSNSTTRVYERYQ